MSASSRGTRFNRIIAFTLSLLIAAAVFAMLPSASALGESYWDYDGGEYAGGVLVINTFTSTDGVIDLTIDGVSAASYASAPAAHGEYMKVTYSINTADFADGTKTLRFTVGGTQISEAAVYFDNTAPIIRSWQAVDALGGRYTAYDMTVWPNDIIVLNTDDTFDVDFTPTDVGSGVASVYATLDGTPISVPYTVEYDYCNAGYHFMSYTLTDNVGNSADTSFRFEIKKPEPKYTNSTVTSATGGYKLASSLSGSFVNFTAKFYLAGILPACGYENAAAGADIDEEVPAGEKRLGARTDGSFYTFSTDGGEIYQTYDIDVSGKTGSIYADYTGETAIGNRAALYVYRFSDGVWVKLSEKASYTGIIELNLGKKGITISDYSDGDTVKVRIRILSNSTERYMNTLSFIPSVRYNSQIGTTQASINGGRVSVIYTGTTSDTLGWYIRGEADYYYSYSPTYSFDIIQAQTVTLEQFNMTFSGDTTTRASLIWQTAARTNTNVQIVPYGDIRPDFSSPRTFTGSTSFNEATGKYVHKLRVTGLTADTKYWVRYGDSSIGLWSQPCLMETAPASEPFSFIAGAPVCGGEGMYEGWNSAYWASDADFLVTTGGEAESETEWEEYFSASRRMFSSMKVAPAAGVQSSSVWWSKYYLSEQSGAGHATGVYYSFVYCNALYVVLNSNDVNTAGELNAAQLRWMKKTLSASDCEWKFVILNKKVSSGSEENAALSAQLTPLFGEYGVDIVFTGGGYLRSGGAAAETVSYGGVTYALNPQGPAYISVSALSEGYVTAAVEDCRLRVDARLPDGSGDSLYIFKTLRFEQIAARIDALPAEDMLTLDDLAEIRSIRSLYDAQDAVLAEQYITNIALLEAAEARLEQILLVTPPTITVNGELPLRAIIGMRLTPPTASAADPTDGSVPVAVSAFGPDGEDPFDGGEVVFTQLGEYRIVYTAEDIDGNEATTEFKVIVKSYILGDVDEDGDISVTDALMILRFAVGLADPDPVEKAESDYDADGTVTISDALLVLRKVAGLTD